MPITEGVLKGLAGGNVISGAGTGYRVDGDRVVRTGVDIQQGWVRWQVADIGTTQLKNVMMTPLHAEFLQEAMGEPVAISWHGPDVNSGKRHTVVAIRTPKRGVDKAPGLMFATIVWLFRFAIAAVVFGAVIGVVTQVLFQTFLPGLVFGLGWLGWGIVIIRNMRAASGALGPARRN